MIFKYFIPEFLDTIKNIILKIDIEESKKRYTALFRDFTRYLKNPFCIVYGDKLNSFILWDDRFNHVICIPIGKMRRKFPIIIVIDSKRYSGLDEYDICNESLPIMIFKNKKIDYTKINYKISKNDYINYIKFINNNRDILLRIIYDNRINSFNVYELEDMLKYD